MSPNFLYSHVGHLVRRLQQISVAVFLEETAALAVTPVQFAALVTIREHPRLDIQRLTNLVAVDRATLGTVIDRLMRSGLVERTEDPRDRRSRVVQLRPAGAALLDKAAPLASQAGLRLLRPLEDGERQVFEIYLRQLVHIGNDLSRVPVVSQGKSDRYLSLYSKPGYLVRRLQQICEGIFLDEVGELGLTPGQYAAIAVIAHANGEDNTHLANAIGLDKVTTGSIVQRLSARGLIEIRVNPSDKRSKSLLLTPAGHDMLRAVQPRVSRADERVLDVFSQSDRLEFSRLLQKVVELNNDVSRAPLKSTTRLRQPRSRKP